MIHLKATLIAKDVTRLFRAVDRVANTVHSMSKRFPYQMALSYADLLRKNLTTGRFSAAYPPYSLRYAEYKRIMVGHLRPWQLFGDVLRSITVFKHGPGFMGGIPAGLFDKGGKGWYGTGSPSAIAAYARANEFGEGRTPARPLFRPTFEQFKDETVPKYSDTFLREVRRWWI